MNHNGKEKSRYTVGVVDGCGPRFMEHGNGWKKPNFSEEFSGRRPKKYGRHAGPLGIEIWCSSRVAS